jgi:uncharacterized RDD family membrane protein YckC
MPPATSKTAAPFATWSQRARALFIDSLWWTVLMAVIPVGPSADDLMLDPDRFASTLVFWLIVLQCVPIVVTGVLWLTWGTSPGKRLLRLRIVDADSLAPMSTRQALLRTFGYLLTFAMCGVGFLWVFFNPKRQALHDRIANTAVICDPAMPAATVRKAKAD